MHNLTDVWQQVEKLLSAGVSLIPVRDRDEGEYKAKTPLGHWKKYQYEIVKLDELWQQIERFNTSAVAIVCGKVSGNLECIDIDVKYRPGIDAILFRELKELYPDILTRLRIQKSPSGGYHLLYRISGETPSGNKKLAGRPLTDDEKASEQSRSHDGKIPKAYNFLETRGEGGYVLCPPSLGYSVIENHYDIPTITWEERCSLITLCQGYNEVIVEDKPYKPSLQEQTYYDTNPFEDYNNRADPVEFLQQFGWTYVKQSGKYIWFTRPGGKKNDVHASFNIEKRFFFIFTTSTELDSDRAYNPATILSKLQFNGDNKKSHAWLVEHGYGIVKPHVKEKILHSKALKGDKELPANFGEEAKERLLEIMRIQTEEHPYGVFWMEGERGGIDVNRDMVYEVAHGLGFRAHYNEIIRIEGYIIKRSDAYDLYDKLSKYIGEGHAPEMRTKIFNALDKELQHAGKHIIFRLLKLDKALVMSDTSDVSYKFYQNGYLAITSLGITQYDYTTEQLPGLIWEHKIQAREFTYDPDVAPTGRYIEFLNLAIGRLDDNLMTTIGYMAHDYKDAQTGYIIVLTEQCADPRHGGGSGKNLFCNLFNYTTSYMSVPGIQVKFDQNFLQAWSGQRLFALSDVDKKFNFLQLKELSSGHGKQKRLFRDEVTIDVTDMPKFIVLTNYSYEISDGGLKRRIIPIEFTNFFTNSGGVDGHFGCHFPSGWTVDDWVGYDTLIANSIYAWLQAAKKLTAATLTITGRAKQFDQEYGPTITEMLAELWPEWLAVGYINNADFRASVERYYNDNAIHHNYRPSIIRLNKAIEDYALEHAVEYTKDYCKRHPGGIIEKGRIFVLKTPF